MNNNKHLIGALELCELPLLSIKNLCVRVDTGAATSSLHVDNIEEFEQNGELWVKFDLHPDMHDVKQVVSREAKVMATKVVKSSTATREKRYVINTEISMANQHWSIRLTLTDRSEMTYLMLFGREAMKNRFIVDPSEEFILGGDGRE